MSSILSKMRSIITKKNVAKNNGAPVYQNVYQNDRPTNSGNITINGDGSNYADKLRRYEDLKAKKWHAWMLWDYNKDQPELEALEKWLREHASD